MAIDVITLAALAAGSRAALFDNVFRTDVRASFEQSPEGVRARKNRLIWWAAAGVIVAAGSVATLLGSLVFKWSLEPVLASIGATLTLTIVVAFFGSLIYRSALKAFAPQAALDAEKQRAEEQEKAHAGHNLARPSSV